MYHVQISVAYGNVQCYSNIVRVLQLSVLYLRKTSRNTSSKISQENLVKLDKLALFYTTPFLFRLFKLHSPLQKCRYMYGKWQNRNYLLKYIYGCNTKMQNNTKLSLKQESKSNKNTY